MLSMNCKEKIRAVLNMIRASQLTPTEVLGYADIMNEFANYVLVTKKGTCFHHEDIQTLDCLLRICNIMYNKTDLDVLPIEDGVYDLLLELYKSFNPNFQVGSEDITWKRVDGIDSREYKDKINPLKFFTEEEQNTIENGLYSRDLYIEPKFTFKDIKPQVLKFNNTITKRTHDTLHNHPSLIGTLDKCKFVLMSEAEERGVADDSDVAVLERDFFADHIKRGILDPNRVITMVLELKYDGVSVEGDCLNTVISARTRGDTSVGQASDITPILEEYPFPHAGKLIGNEPIGVKFEAIMTHADLYRFNLMKNYNYKNCRTAIIGLMGNSDASSYRDYITLIPLALDREQANFSTMTREEEIIFLNKYFATKGQPLRYSVIKGTYTTCLYLIKKFVEEAEVARNFLDFMYDGVVVSYMDEDIREALGRENYINKYSMAIKFNPLVRQTIFNGYTYTVGQDGSITPMIHYNQVEFFGTIHTKSTGSSYERFISLGLRPGDIIDVEYTNDVMPYVTKPDCEYNRRNTNPLCEFITHCPSCGQPLHLSKSGKTMNCINIECPDRVNARMANMLQKLNIKDFGEEKLRVLGRTHLVDLLNITEAELLDLGFGPGNTANFLNRMQTIKTTQMYDYQIVGALGFTGIASKKWKLILEHYTVEELCNIWLNGELKHQHIKGVKSALEVIDSEMEYFINDMLYISGMPNVLSSKGLVNDRISVRCSGFRNHELMALLRDMGYDADDSDSASVTKSTNILLVPMANYTSSKTRKVGPNTQIIPVNEFIEQLGEIVL